MITLCTRYTSSSPDATTFWYAAVIDGEKYEGPPEKILEILWNKQSASDETALLRTELQSQDAVILQNEWRRFSDPAPNELLCADCLEGQSHGHASWCDLGNAADRARARLPRQMSALRVALAEIVSVYQRYSHTEIYLLNPQNDGHEIISEFWGAIKGAALAAQKEKKP